MDYCTEQFIKVRSNHFMFSLGKKSKNKNRNENNTDII